MPQRFCIVSSDAAHKSKIQVFHLIAVLDAVFRARCLVLVTIILQGFGKTDCGQARFIENVMIATASEAIDNKNQANCLASVDFFDRASQFAGRRIAIVLIAAAGQKANAMRRAGRGVAANDIVVEHSAYRVSLLLHPFKHPGAAQQPLLLA